MNNFRTAVDGRTPEELRTGRPWNKTMAVYGERVLGYPLESRNGVSQEGCHIMWRRKRFRGSTWVTQRARQLHSC
eukprot:3741266-Amphidinium_carterae.1